MFNIFQCAAGAETVFRLICLHGVFAHDFMCRFISLRYEVEMLKVDQLYFEKVVAFTNVTGERFVLCA